VCCVLRHWDCKHFWALLAPWKSTCLVFLIKNISFPPSRATLQNKSNDLWGGHVRCTGMTHAARGSSLFLWSLPHRYLYLEDTWLSSRARYHGLSRVYSVPPNKFSYITSKTNNGHFSLNTDSDSSVRYHINPLPANVENLVSSE
jgi:hypothetical protein